MEKMIGYCGYNCHLCQARSDDPETRQKMVDGWRKYLGHQNYTAENVKCCGCLGEGEVADKNCEARPCARAKGIENCVFCDDFPCSRIKKLMASKEGMFIYCYPNTAGITEEEYNLSMRQFVSMPNILKMLVKVGKLPSWIVE